MREKRFLSTALAAVMGISAASGLVLMQEKPALAAGAKTEYFIGSAAGAETFDNYSIHSQWNSTIVESNIESISYVAPPEVDAALSTDNKPTYVNDKSLVVKETKQNSTSKAAYTFDNAVRNGKVYLSTDMYFSGSNPDTSRLSFTDSSGNDIIVVSVSASNSVAISGKGINNTTFYGNTVTTRGGYGAHIDITLDLDTSKATIILDYINSSKVRTKKSKTIDIAADADINCFNVIAYEYYKDHYTYTYIDNTLLYAEYTENKATNIKVSYRTTEGTEIAADTISLAAESYAAGETADYYVPAYIEGTDGSLYKTTNKTDNSGTIYRRTSPVLTAGSNSVAETVAFEADSGSYQYFEFDGTEPYSTRPQYASNGSVAAVGSENTNKTLFTAESNGLYDVIIATASVGNDGTTRKTELKTNSYTIDNTNIDYYSYPKVFNYSNVHLDAGDKLLIKSVNSHSALDYVLVKKTSDYTYPQPTQSANGKTRKMEKLNRGTYAARCYNRGIYVSWRLLGTESLTNQAFDIYRSSDSGSTYSLIHTTGSHDATNYMDTDISDKAGDTYKNYRYIVVPAGKSITGEKAVTPDAYSPNTVSDTYIGSANSYFDIPISKPDWVAPANVGENVADGTAKTNDDTVTSETGEGDGTGGEGEAAVADGSYTANDASVGDLDGDGDYELVLKWNPSNSTDNMGGNGTYPSRFTSNVYIDAYEISRDNTGYMWRIDLGVNIRAGAHYTQFMVYDLDCDGKAEVAMRTAPGSKDGQGNYVNKVLDRELTEADDNGKNYRNKYGLILEGPEYLTIFDGETGAALATTDFIERGAPDIWMSTWGDNWGNRIDRFLAGIAYLDGVNPSLIMTRGYYARAVAAAYNWDGYKIRKLWVHDGTDSTGGTLTTYNEDNTVRSTEAITNTLRGQGNHSLAVCDADGDGKDEIVFGSAVLDDDGHILNNTGHGHGDAHHVGDFDNDGEQEIFTVHEASSICKAGFGAELRKAKNGKIIVGQYTGGDNGRGIMDNFIDNADMGYSQFWSAGIKSAYGWDGTETGEAAEDLTSNTTTWYGAESISTVMSEHSFTNFGIYWDADLARELLDGHKAGGAYLAKLQAYTAEDGSTQCRAKRIIWNGTTMFPDAKANNSTKANPCLSADILGDWREEVIYRGSDSTYLRVFVPTSDTTYRLHTLMHDCQYREGVAIENVGYNQPPHTSYYIGSAALAKDENTGEVFNYLTPAVAYTKVEMIEPADKTVSVTAADKFEKVSAEGGGTWDAAITNIVSVPAGMTVGSDDITITIGGINATKNDSLSEKFSAITGGDISFTVGITDIPMTVTELKDVEVYIAVGEATSTNTITIN